MSLTVTPAAPIDGDAVIPLVAAREFLRVDGNDEDATIAALRDAALVAIERHCAVSLTSRQWVATFDGLHGSLRFPVSPVTAVASIAYLDTVGVLQPLGTTLWRRAGDVLLCAAGQSWPAVPWGEGAVTVTFTAGFTDADRPAPLVQAARMLLTHYYTNRTAVVTGTIATALPLAVESLCAMYRVPVIG